VTLSRRLANVRSPLEIAQDQNAKKPNLVASRRVAHIRLRRRRAGFVRRRT
jgi:hypothetical protein